MKNPDGSHSHTPIDHQPHLDVPPPTGDVDTETLTRDLGSKIDIAVRGRLRRLAAEHGLSFRKAVPLLLAELVR